MSSSTGIIFTCGLAGARLKNPYADDAGTNQIPWSINVSLPYTIDLVTNTNVGL